MHTAAPRAFESGRNKLQVALLVSSNKEKDAVSTLEDQDEPLGWHGPPGVGDWPLRPFYLDVVISRAENDVGRRVFALGVLGWRADDAGIANSGAKVVLPDDLVQLLVPSELTDLDEVVLELQVSAAFGAGSQASWRQTLRCDGQQTASRRMDNRMRQKRREEVSRC